MVHRLRRMDVSRGDRGDHRPYPQGRYTLPEPLSPAELAQRIWASIHGAVSLELRSICFVDDTDAHFEALLETLIIGLLPDRGIRGIAD